MSGEFGTERRRWSKPPRVRISRRVSGLRARGGASSAISPSGGSRTDTIRLAGEASARERAAKKQSPETRVVNSFQWLGTMFRDLT
ncbi:MAG: hypothetical protein C3F11_12555 [Methylocystaceae bacterium]|nr:MAG: hypothetical protein C3F11_12555 [Methylocystaceae bacterium]